VPYLLPIALWVLAVATVITVIQRIWHVYRQFQRSGGVGAAPVGAAPGATEPAAAAPTPAADKPAAGIDLAEAAGDLAGPVASVGSAG
jgi:CDP-diacylglycerol--glycerol-3-phosphate 3-phosphatidyltransferase